MGSGARDLGGPGALPATRWARPGPCGTPGAERPAERSGVPGLGERVAEGGTVLAPPLFVVSCGEWGESGCKFTFRTERVYIPESEAFLDGRTNGPQPSLRPAVPLTADLQPGCQKSGVQPVLSHPPCRESGPWLLSGIPDPGPS